MDFAKDKISVLFHKIFYPTMFGMLSVGALTAVDGIFVGHNVGSDGIAAVNICMPLLMILTGVGLMLGIGCSVIASVALSKGKIKIARLNITQSLLFGVVLTFILSSLMLSNLDKTAYILGSSDYLQPLTKDYLFWFIPSLVFEMIILISMFVIRLDGAPNLVMWFSFASSATNIFLDWLFIFSLQMGIGGAALATAISFFIGSVLSILYLVFWAKVLHLYPITIEIKGFFLFVQSIAKQCYIGMSALWTEAMLAVLTLMGNYIFMRYLGDDGVGSFGVCCYYIPFVYMVGNAIAQSAQPIISYNYGLADYERVKTTEKIALRTAVVSGLLVMIIFIFAPQILVGLFINNSSSAAQLAISGLPYFATGFICFIINLTAIGYFQSVENVKAATIFSLLRGFVFLIPVFLIMPQLLGVVGIWLAMPISEALISLLIGGYYLIQKCNLKIRKP